MNPLDILIWCGVLVAVLVTLTVAYAVVASIAERMRRPSRMKALEDALRRVYHANCPHNDDEAGLRS